MFFKKKIIQNNLKKGLFVILSSQIIYILMHLQFLLGMPQAALSLQDSIVFLIFAMISYILSNGQLKVYFIGLAVILWPIELQYFYIQTFSKPFLLSELYKFPTLLTVSIFPLKLLYGGLFILWSYGISYFIYHAIKNWIKLPIITKLIPLVGIYYCINLFSTTIEITEWLGNSRQVFYFKGIIRTIRSRPVNNTTVLSPESVEKSYSILRQKEKTRSIYPISKSYIDIPMNKRPIFMFVFESFYDYKHFIPLFQTDPFPKEYRKLVDNNTYSGPNSAYGSFDSRFISLTGSSIIDRPSQSTDINYQTLATLLTKYGYTTTTLESVNPTYNLLTYYKLWGFEQQQYEIFSTDWGGNFADPYLYEQNVSKIITETPSDIIPFYFGFTYLGHGGSCRFTDRIPDPSVDISSFLSLFPNQNKAKQLLKASIFNAERLVSLKKIILKKYPNALIVLKVDHYSTELYKSFTDTNDIPQELKDNFMKDPTPLPFIVVDGTNGILELPRGFSPANIPLMILAESKLPYKNTIPSLLYRNIPKNIISTYNQLYLQSNTNLSQYVPINLNDPVHKEIQQYYEALKTISTDLYKNNKNPYTFQLIEQNTK